MNNNLMTNQGIMYSQSAPKATFCNPLGVEKINRLLNSGSNLPKIVITEEEMDRAVCTHRHPETGEYTLIELPDQRVKCRVCGAEFSIVEDVSMEDVKLATQNLHDILHTAKIMMVNEPEAMITENFQILAVVDKVPELFAIAENAYRKYTRVQPTIQQYGGNNMNGSTIWSSIVGPRMGGGANMIAPPNMGQQNPQVVQLPTGQMAQVVYDQYGNMQYVPVQQQPVQMPTTSQATMCAPAQSNGFGYTAPQTVAPAGTQDAVVTTTVNA